MPQAETVRKRRRDEALRQFCSFTLSGRLLGVDILHVKEVNTERAFTPVPHAPPEVMGFVNVRGQIHLILDLRRILGLPPAEAGEKSRLVLFKPTVGEAFGVQVDSIGDVVEVAESSIESGAAVQDRLSEECMDVDGAPADMVAGVCRLQQELMLVVNARNLLSAVERTNG